MLRNLIIALVATLVLYTPVPAYITQVSVTPANPEVGDSVQLVVEGYFSDGCWAVQGVELQVNGFEIDVAVNAVDTWLPAHACVLIIIPYGATFKLGQLAPGAYTVTVHEAVSSLRSYGDQEIVPFTVGGPYSPPTASEPIAPKGDFILYDSRPGFIWTSSTDTDPDDTVRYDLEISPDAYFISPMTEGDLSDTIEFCSASLDVETAYWWRLMSRDRFGLVTTSATAQFRMYKPGDLNESWTVTSADLVTMINYVFKGGALTVPACAGMVYGNDTINTSDILWVVNYLYKSGPKPEAGCATDPGEFFPITMGSYWIYAYELSADSLLWQVIAHVGDTAVIDRPGNSSMPHGGPLTVRLSGDGVELNLSGEGWVEYYHFLPGRSWVHRDPFDCDDFGVYRAERENGMVSTPAGSFFNCLRIERSDYFGCADAGTTREWWAPGVGLVKWEELTIAGPRYGMLTSYFVAP